MKNAFISLSLTEVQKLLSASTRNIEKFMSAVETKLSIIKEEMTELKIELYIRFEKSINLET